MNETLVKYLAGLMDADGSLSFAFKVAPGMKVTDPNDRYLQLELSLTASDAVDRLGFVASLPDVTGMGSSQRYGREKQFVAWKISKRSDLEMLLPRLTKHMVVKARHWQWLFDEWRALRSASNVVSKDVAEDLRARSLASRRSNVGPLRPKNHPTWAWLAGYLDGDGWYRLKHERSGRWTVNVGAVAHINDVSVLEFLQRSFGGYIYEHGQSAGVRVWRRALGKANRSFALRFLPNLAKHAKLKKPKIQAIIHFHRQRLSDQGTTVQATV